MEKIIIGFSRPKKWKPFAWLIMKGFGTPYDHVYVKFHSESLDRDIIYQASKMMINFMGTVLFNLENIVVAEFEIEISPESKKALMQFAVDNAGKPYSIKEAFGLGLVRICELFGKKIKNPYKEGNSEYVCSILVDYILEKYADIGVKNDFENADPKDVYDLLDLMSGQLGSGVTRSESR